jgi:hypothetical protein
MLLGVRFWMQKYSYLVPKFHVFRYAGYDPTTGLYYFTGYKNPNIIITKNHYQLTSSDFMPFCIDDKRIREEAKVQPDGDDPNAIA